MTEHLPECPSFNACVLPDCIHGKSRCICDALRACEERMERLLTESYKAYNEQQFNNGYDCGIDSAIDAVNRMSDTEAILSSEVITTLDVLRRHDPDDLIAAVLMDVGYLDGVAQALRAVEALPDSIFQQASWVKHEQAINAINYLRIEYKGANP